MKAQPVSIEKFVGIKRGASTFDQKEGELVTATNVEITPDGKIVKRRPLELQWNSSASITGIEPFPINIFYRSAPQIVVKTSTGTWFETTSGAYIGGSTSLTSTEDSVQYDAKLWMVGSAQNLAYTGNGSTMVLNHATINASLAVTLNTRLFVVRNNGGSTTEASQVRFSEVYSSGGWGGGASWPATNVVGVGVGDGEDITALAILNNSIVVFKASSTWILYPDAVNFTDWVLRKVNDYIGCSGGHTPQLIGGLLYFTSHLGVYRTDGTTFEKISPQYVSDGVALPTFPLPTSTNEHKAVVWRDHYVIFRPWSQPCYAFNTLNDTWTEWHFNTVFKRPVVDELTQNLYAYNFNGASGAHKCVGLKFSPPFSSVTGWTDWDAQYTVTVKTGWMDFGEPASWKFIPLAYLSMDTGATAAAPNTVLTYWKDRNLTAVNTLVDAGHTDNPQHLKKFKGPGTCRSLQFQLTNQDSSYWTIDKLAFDVRLRNAVGRMT